MLGDRYKWEEVGDSNKEGVSCWPSLFRTGMKLGSPKDLEYPGGPSSYKETKLIESLNALFGKNDDH